MEDLNDAIGSNLRAEPDEPNAEILDHGWKDELNLAEFPIAALTDRVPDGQTTLVFEDKLEPHDSDPIVRRLTIMGTHKHGLPDLAGRRGAGRPDPAHEAPEWVHRRARGVLAL
jgi:hypothetical protein